jgi:hypothetical protein
VAITAVDFKEVVATVRMVVIKAVEVASRAAVTIMASGIVVVDLAETAGMVAAAVTVVMVTISPETSRLSPVS